MVGIVLTGHGQFATGLADALGMIAGQQDAFYPVPFLEATAGDYPQELRKAISTAAQDGAALVLCDFVGGTPFNQSMLAGAEQSGVQVVAGANLPMLLELLSTRTAETPINELVDMAVEAGKTGVAHVELDFDDDDDDNDFEGI